MALLHQRAEKIGGPVGIRLAAAEEADAIAGRHLAARARDRHFEKMGTAPGEPFAKLLYAFRIAGRDDDGELVTAGLCRDLPEPALAFNDILDLLGAEDRDEDAVDLAEEFGERGDALAAFGGQGVTPRR